VTGIQQHCEDLLFHRHLHIWDGYHETTRLIASFNVSFASLTFPGERLSQYLRTFWRSSNMRAASCSCFPFLMLHWLKIFCPLQTKTTNNFVLLMRIRYIHLLINLNMKGMFASCDLHVYNKMKSVIRFMSFEG
jgi:hypothetical protein